MKAQATARQQSGLLDAAKGEEAPRESGDGDRRLMTRNLCIHILRNPYGHTPEEIKQAQLFACDEIEHLDQAYTNMRDWAGQHGVDTVCRNARSDDHG